MGRTFGSVTCMENHKAIGIIACGKRMSIGRPQVPPASLNEELLQFRHALPIWRMRDDILEEIKSRQVVLISGDTGSGKTTQIPQFILEDHARRNKVCRIICAQRNEISAAIVCKRIAKERNEDVGVTVGYDLLKETKVSPKGVLTYCTYGMLMWALMAGDSTLATATHIVVDDIQERNRFSDLLLIALRAALRKFPCLHLILMSATRDTARFAEYFNNCRVFNVPGSQHNVQEYFLEDILNRNAESDQNIREEDMELWDIFRHSFNDDNIDINLLMTILHEVHSSEREGTIIVFLSGYDDILALRERIVAEEKRLSEARKYTLYILHPYEKIQDQISVLNPAPQGVRKIILSTNKTETGVTIDDVMCVIDTGKVREESYDAVSGTCIPRLVWISRACSMQRKGLAGSTRPGICYHMFYRAEYEALQQYHTPEILTMTLQELCLHTKLLATADTPIATYLGQAIDPPLPGDLTNAVQLLKTIGALDPWEGLTELGHHLLNLPVEPRHGKMLLYSIVLQCVDPVLTVVCCLAHRDVFVLPAKESQENAFYPTRNLFSAGTYSDHVALFQAFQCWQSACDRGNEHVFCEQNFISAAVMKMVSEMKKELMWVMRKSHLISTRNGHDIRDLNRNSRNWAVVRAALCAGMYPNLIQVDRQHMQLRTHSGRREFTVMLHPSSALHKYPMSPHSRVAASHSATVEALPSDFVIYEEFSYLQQFCYARCCTVVSPLTVALFAGPARMPVIEENLLEERPDGRNTTLKLDDSVVFHVDAETAHLVLQLRQKWHSLLHRRMRAPFKTWSKEEQTELKEVLTFFIEEQRELGLRQQIPGIGHVRRPRRLH